MKGMRLIPPLLAMALVALPGVAKALSGAIFTTDSLCQVVNKNHYANKTDVYLNGGPHGNGPGLDDGDYYVQVTDPSGKHVLGTSVGTGNPTPVHVTGGAFAFCYQLCTIAPGTGGGCFDDTPNNGGVYKVWVSTVASFDHNKSKTDNFKVDSANPPPPNPGTTLAGTKFSDDNGDGVFDPTEGPIQGVQIVVTVTGDQHGPYTTSTDVNGVWTLDLPNSDNGAAYTVCEVVPTGYKQTAPTGGCYSDALPASGGVVGDLDFGNYKCPLKITCPKDTTVECPGSTDPTSTGSATATDDGCGTPVITYKDQEATGDCTKPGHIIKTITRTWTAVDSYGSIDVCIQTIYLVDTTAPVITAPQNISDCLKTALGNTYSLSATAADLCDSNVVVTGTRDDGGKLSDPFTCGITVKITWTASDACGNAADPKYTYVTVTGATVTAKKFYDTNADGKDNDGAVIAGWKMTLSGTDSTGVAFSATANTAASGIATFSCVPLGNYTVAEAKPAQTTWVSSTPTSYPVGVSGCSSTSAFSFGNYCNPTPGGLSKGFWSNNNGKALETAADFVTLTGLNLRNVNGTNADFTGTLAANKTALGTFLTNGTNASNMAAQLSAQLAAAKLNVIHGITTNPGVIIDPVKLLDVNGVIAYANQLLANPIVGGTFNGQNGSLTTASSALRTEQGRLQTILDNLNNGKAFIQPPGICGFTFP